MNKDYYTQKLRKVITIRMYYKNHYRNLSNRTKMRLDKIIHCYKELESTRNGNIKHIFLKIFLFFHLSLKDK